MKEKQCGKTGDVKEITFLKHSFLDLTFVQR